MQDFEFQLSHILPFNHLSQLMPHDDAGCMCSQMCPSSLLLAAIEAAVCFAMYLTRNTIAYTQKAASGFPKDATFQHWSRIAWWSQPSYNVMTVSNYRSALWVLLENVMLASMQVWGLASRLLCVSGYFGFHLVIVRPSVGPQYVMVCSLTKRGKMGQNAFGFLSIKRSKMERGWFLCIYFWCFIQGYILD